MGKVDGAERSRLIAIYQRASMALGALVLIIAALVMLGWVLDVEVLWRPLARHTSMKMNTAVALFLLGLALVVLHVEDMAEARSKVRSSFIPLCGGLVAVLGTATLAEYLWGIDLRIDEALILDRGAATSLTPPGRMSMITALCFMFLGAALTIMRTSRCRDWMWQALALTTLFLSGLGLMGYLYDAQSMARFFPYSTVAIHTDIALTLLSLGLLFARPRVGFMAVFVSNKPGGHLAKRLLPAAVSTLVMLGLLVHMGARHNLFDLEISLIVIVSLGATIISALTWTTSRYLDQLDDIRQKVAYQLELVIEHAPGAAAMLDRDMKYIWMSKRWISDYHLEHTDYRGRAHYEIFPEITQAWKDVYRRCLEGAVERCDEERFERADGAIWIRWEVRPWRDDCGEIGGILIFTEDITHRKLAEDALKEMNAELESRVEQRTQEVALQAEILRNMAEGTCLIKATDGTIIHANPKFEAMFGYGAGEMTGRHVSIVNYEAANGDSKRVAQEIMASIFANNVATYEVQNIRKDGTPFWCRATTSQFHDPRHGLVLVAVHEDITARKVAADALRRSEQRYRDLVELAADGIFVADSTGRYTDVNRAGCDMLGLSREEIVGKTLRDLISPEDTGRLLATMKRIEQPGNVDVAEWILKRKDGRSVTVEIGTTMNPDGRMMAFVRDITARRQAERERTAAESRYRSLVENAHDAIVIADAHGRIRLVNKQIESMFGYKPEELLDQPLELLVPERHRDRHVGNRTLYAAGPHARPMGAGLDLCGRRKDGSEVSIDISLSPVLIDGELQITAIIRDITARRNIELQLRAAVQAREDVVAIVSHDLKNPLAAILMNAQLLDRVPATDPAVKARLSKIAQSVNRSAMLMQRLIMSILDLAKIQSGTFAIEAGAQDIRSIVDTCIEPIGALAAAKSIHVVQELEPDLPRVAADHDRIVQVLSNLLGNAIKFTPEGGLVRVHARRSGDHVQVSVSDTGPGIPEEQVPHIFDRYWQAKETAKLGSGLGLAIAKGIVDAHGGRIWADSKLGEGSTFCFTVPVA